MISTRLVKLQCSEDPVVAKMAISEHYTSQLLKWTAPIYREGNAMNSGKELRRLGWSQMLTSTSIDGQGLRDAGYVPYAHQWVMDGSSLMSGRNFSATIAARINCLPTRAKGAHGKSRVGHRRHCNCCGLSQLETLAHISQVCPRTWGPRNQRHNQIAEMLAKFLIKKGYTVWQE